MKLDVNNNLIRHYHDFVKTYMCLRRMIMIWMQLVEDICDVLYDQKVFLITWHHGHMYVTMWVNVSELISGG